MQIYKNYKALFFLMWIIEEVNQIIKNKQTNKPHFTLNYTDPLTLAVVHNNPATSNNHCNEKRKAQILTQFTGQNITKGRGRP